MKIGPSARNQIENALRQALRHRRGGLHFRYNADTIVENHESYHIAWVKAFEKRRGCFGGSTNGFAIHGAGHIKDQHGSGLPFGGPELIDDSRRCTSTRHLKCGYCFWTGCGVRSILQGERRHNWNFRVQWPQHELHGVGLLLLGKHKIEKQACGFRLLLAYPFGSIEDTIGVFAPECPFRRKHENERPSELLAMLQIESNHALFEGSDNV